MRLTTLKATNMELTDAIRAYVDEKIEQLRRICGDFDPADDLKMEVGKSTQHHAKGPYYHAEMHLVLPGKELRAVHEGEDLYEAIDNVKDQLRRQIKEYKDRLKDKSQRASRPGKE
ncbi:ribosome-associated translation inhibitor RaiA [Candidatus Parcubacteria bacterium]|nr:ribosome-associated translation inhibitor RaiA [Candidatus Parcubacteria bacterium]